MIKLDDDGELMKFVKNFMSKCKIPESVIAQMVDERYKLIYKSAFTARDFDPTMNYEWYEHIGDAIHAAFIVKYFYYRFPHFRNNEGVRVVARLRIRYASGKELAKLAEKHGMWEFINASPYLKQRERSSLLEDVFEAFIGAISVVEDKIKKTEYGNDIVHKILKFIYDQEEFDTTFESLFDPKTRLKEFCDKNKNEKLVCVKGKNGNLFTSLILLNSKRIGYGENAKRIDAEQESSQQAIDYLKKNGFQIK